MIFLLPLKNGRFNISIKKEWNGYDLPEIEIQYGKHYQATSCNGYTNHTSGYWVCRKAIRIGYPFIQWPYKWFDCHPVFWNSLHFDQSGKFRDWNPNAKNNQPSL